MFEKLAKAVNTDEALMERGKNSSFTLLIEVGELETYISVENGCIVNLISGNFLMRKWDLAIRAPRSSWSKFWCKYPVPGFQDIFAMNRFNHCKIEGNTDILLSNIRYLKDVLDKPRLWSRD